MIKAFHGKNYYMELRNLMEYRLCLQELSKTVYLRNLDYEFLAMTDENGEPIKVLRFNEAPESFNKTPKYQEWEHLKAQIYKRRRK